MGKHFDCINRSRGCQNREVTVWLSLLGMSLGGLCSIQNMTWGLGRKRVEQGTVSVCVTYFFIHRHLLDS